MNYHDISSIYPSQMTSLPNPKSIVKIFTSETGTYNVIVSWMMVGDMHDWCEETFGYSDFIRWYYDNSVETYVFQNEADRNWFVLRWSS